MTDIRKLAAKHARKVEPEARKVVEIIVREALREYQKSAVIDVVQGSPSAQLVADRIERDHYSQAAEDIKAELRQERERFATLLIDRDGWKDEGAIALRKHYESQAALSRAEETIDRIRGLRFRLSDSAELDAILTEYSEQKGASDD